MRGRQITAALDQHLEPAAVELLKSDGRIGTEVLTSYSAAVSLKRIADALEGGRPDRMTIFELIADRMPSQ